MERWGRCRAGGALLAGLLAVAGPLAAAQEKIKLPSAAPSSIMPDVPTVELDSKRRAKSEAENRAQSIAQHVKNLNDKDPEVRQTSAQILGQMRAVEAIPHLIEALRDRQIMVQMYAHGALVRITGKNFGYKNYTEWAGWWATNRDEFMRRQTVGASDLSRDRARTSNTQGLIYLQAGDIHQAYRMFLDAVNSDPETPDYRNNLGLVVMDMGRTNPTRYIDAIVYFQEAIGINDQLPQPFMNIGSCFARLDRHIEAQHWFRIAVEKDRNGILWENCWTLGKELLQKADYHLAKEYLEEARAKAERNRVFDPRIYRDLALVYYALDMHHSAYREIQNVRRLNFELNPEFIEKVRKALKDQGVDPDKEDEKAIQEQRSGYGEPDRSKPPAPTPDPR